MNQKAESPINNHYIFACNEQFWAIYNKVLAKYLADFHTDGTLFYSKVNGIGYKVGATFTDFEIGKIFCRPTRRLVVVKNY